MIGDLDRRALDKAKATKLGLDVGYSLPVGLPVSNLLLKISFKSLLFYSGAYE